MESILVFQLFLALNGIEQIIELELTDEEKASLDQISRIS